MIEQELREKNVIIIIEKDLVEEKEQNLYEILFNVIEKCRNLKKWLIYQQISQIFFSLGASN